MLWLSEWWVFIAALIVIFVPGLCLGIALGIRRFLLLAVALPLTVAIIGACALLNQVVHFRWGLLPLAVATVVVSGLAFAVRLAWRRHWPDRAPESPRRLLWIALTAGLVVGGGIIAVRQFIAIGDPNHISQTFDNVYHLNAVRFIMDTGQVTPFKQLIPGFYPDMWHALVVPVVYLSGSTIPISVNVVNIVLAAVVWPLGCVLLARHIFGPSAIVTAAAGVLSAAFAGFPMLLLDFGVLYPNAISVAMLPAVFASVLLVAKVSKEPVLSPATALCLMLVMVPALALAHPSSLMALIAISFPVCLLVFLRSLRVLRDNHASKTRWTVTIACWVIGALVAAAVLLKARPTYAQAFWPPSQSFPHAVWSAIASEVPGRPFMVAGTVLLLLGVAGVFIWRSQRWLVASFAIMAALFVVCASFPAGSVRYWLSGTWYSDIERLAAIMPVVAIPLAVGGASLLQEWLLRFVRSRRGERGPSSTNGPAIAFGVALVAVIAVITQLEPSMQAASASQKASYAENASSPLLTTDERTLLDRLDREVPANAVIAGSPWTGTSLSYAIANRRAMVPHIYSEITPEQETVIAKLRVAAQHPSVCTAIRNENVRYVLDFGKREVHGARHPFPGLENLSSSGSVRLVDQVGPAKLYKVTACW